MPGNKEDTEKCLEKLKQMQKFVPFLDFMIEKISERNNETSLESQLSKLKVLRSMIAEKSEKYSWEVIIKVEDVIQRLIAKLDVKDRYGQLKERVDDADSENRKASMATSVSIVPSSTSTASVTTESNPQSTAVGGKPRQVSTSTVDLIMKTLKTSVEQSKITDRDKELLSNSLGPNKLLEVSAKPMETDLDKDLDGYDLIDCPSLSETSSSNTAVESAPEKVSSHDDLLSSSREKLLKSLQSRHFPARTNLPPSQVPAGDNNTEKTSNSQSSSAFSLSQINLGEPKARSDLSEASDNNSKDKNVGGLGSPRPAPGKPISSAQKTTIPLLSPTEDRLKTAIPLLSPGEDRMKTATPTTPNLKQKLKEKFSTDICEVYRVPGKSVGGSLRSLKESKDIRKSFSKEEDDSCKPDAVHSSLHSRSSSSHRKSHADSSANEKKEHRNSDTASHKTSNSGMEKRLESSHSGSRTGRNESRSRSNKNESHRNENAKKKRDGKSTSEEKKTKCKKAEEKGFELDKLNDDELLDFVKENMQSLPHLAKLKSSELRKAVQSSVNSNFLALDPDAVSEISDDSFHDFDDVAISESKSKPKSVSRNKSETKEPPHPLASVKMTQVGPDGVAKNVKPIVEPSKETKILDEVGDRTHDMDDVSIDDNMDDDDYAMKLIEDTTPKTVLPQKKGLLELPMPVGDDLFEEISSIGSFEPSSQPTENRDPRLAKLAALSDNRNKSSEKSENPSDPCKTAKDSWTSRPPANLPKENNHSTHPQTGSISAPTDKTHRGHGPMDPQHPQHPQSGNWFSFESNDPKLRNPVNAFQNNSPRCRLSLPSEPKSYAEYKRMKQKELEKNSQHSSKDNPRICFPDVSDNSSRSVVEKDDGNAARKNQDPRHSVYTKQSNRNSQPPFRGFEDRKSFSKQWRKSSHTDPREKRSTFEELKKEEDERGKKIEEKRYSSETEELVSPLEELYRSDDKPKTGRGYGIQKFKIPKKVVKPAPQGPSKENKSQGPPNNGARSDTRTEVSTGQCQVDSTKRNKESVRTDESEKSEISQAVAAEPTKDLTVEAIKNSNQPESSDIAPVHSGSVEDVPSKSVESVDSSVDQTKTDLSITAKDSVNCDVVLDKPKPNESPVLESSTVPVSTDEKALGLLKDGSQTDSNTDKTDASEQNSNLRSDTEEPIATTKLPKTVSEDMGKCDTQTVESDPKVVSSSGSEVNSGKDAAMPTDKNATVQKEEITQEFVEALIRKSFQSGEGKLLLAQVKLFEEFAKKLNSKKLKTIQKIINSESCSSSSSSESSSEDDRKKRKTKKLEQKSKKRKKKGKKSRKYKSSSSSSSYSPTSSSESEETGEEESHDKKEVRSRTKKSESTSPEETKSKRHESPSAKKKRGRKPKQTPNQNEEITNESPLPEDTNTGKPADVGTKEPEQKKRTGRAKGKTKTELDRLHEDIRSMFINDGVVTATGRRMCRILKQSGGNVNNLDIVKESAKMVEEEKLKKVQKRPSRSTDSNASQSSDKGTKARSSKLEETHLDHEDEDLKLKLAPRVCLQRVDLDNFGYAVKISDDCISFRRMKGRNTAIRGAGVIPVVRKSEKRNPGWNVFLARNKRKYERLRDSNRKKVYRAKNLMDIVKNLPLKMAKMKHLQICDRKTEVEKNKNGSPEKPMEDEEICQRRVDLSNSELQCYAFEKKRRIYICKLCNHITRNITGHYKSVHPEHEVLISRFCLREAESAKLESEKNNYDLKKNSLASSKKRKRKPPCNRSSTYRCRMCSCKTTDLNSFAAHVSSHTGEYRYRCPGEECAVRVHSREDLKFHILAKHPKNRYELYNKIIQSYPLTVEGNLLFGYLCSLCHFVQICRNNLEKHISIQHGSSEDAEIIKVNMSWGVGIGTRKKTGNSGKSDSKETSPVSNVRSDDEEDENSDSERPDVEKELESKKKRQRSEDELEEGNSDGSDAESLASKRILLEGAEVAGETPGDIKRNESDEENQEEDGEIDVEGDGNMDEDNVDNELDVEDCVDLKTISNLKGSDIISSMETPETSDGQVAENPDSKITKLQVGPLAALISPHSSLILYECYVKGCLFSTRAFDLFEKHINISHYRTHWNGTCGLCCTGEKDKSAPGKGQFKLLTALNHLKLHARGRQGGGKLSAEDLIMELKLVTPPEVCDNVECGETDSVEGESKEMAGVKGQTADGTSEKLYPARPLLRVRNLLGDRLSTPKGDENDVVAINEEDSSNPESSTDSSKMFTIENVRSLTDTPEGDSELKIEQVCSLKDLVTKPAPQLGSGKAILVRPCPTRKIAIRPEPSSLSVDVGTINVVQPPVVGHSVMLSPISSNSPIRIISTGLSPNPTFTVKPIVVSSDSVGLSTSNLVPVIGPSLSPTVTTTTILPVSANADAKTNESPAPQENKSDLVGSKIGVDVEVIATPRVKSPTSPSVIIHHVAKNPSSDVEDAEEKDTITPQRFSNSPNTGKKSVKDAKIYKEMLTKTKLCHLFKCMGIECSFTCNNENVFTQHIGLHEAQRRLKRNKGLKSIYLKSANKTTRAFYWQQCAYCCEVLSNTNKALSHHILEEHGHCMYQCAFCFYRAVSQCYVEIHQNLAHSQILKTTPRVIYKCKPLKVPPSQVVALEKHGRKQSVRPYHCDQCGRKFYITHEFINHLQTEHRSLTAYTCHICKNLCFKVNRLLNHYKLHSYSTYQCAYCLHGTENEEDMVFHLCNFHFSQPAVMYIRALAEGQSVDEIQKPNKKKKQLGNQLDLLKVIVYESKNPNLDCIVEADPDEEIPENISESSLDLSSIVAELGIYTDSQSSASGMTTPLIKELASIGDKSAKHLTVKTLLPNAQFSSENENGTENCSVLISSGLSIPSDPENEKEMNIPLGQLPLEAVSVQHKEAPPSSTSSIGSPDKNLKLNEIIVNLQHKDKNLGLPATEEEKSGQSPVKHSSAVHKLPPVVLGRSSSLKSVYPSKSGIVKKKAESQGIENNDAGKTKSIGEKEEMAAEGKTSQKESSADGGSRRSSVEKPTEGVGQPLITNVVSLSNRDFEKEETQGFGQESIIISDMCFLSPPSAETKDNSSPVVINIKPAVSVGSVLKPPIIRLEDFPVGEETTNTSIPPKEVHKDSAEVKEPDKPQSRPSSPDIIILEDEKGKDIVTVTLDSDEEKEENGKKDSPKKAKTEKPIAGDETIRKEMELLRNQIANETDSLLMDDQEETEKPARDLTLNLKPSEDEPSKTAKTLMSPIEEAICSLNKKLESENQEAQKKEEEKREKAAEESCRKSDNKVAKPAENKPAERPRTRFGGRKECTENVDKSDGDESNNKRDVKFRRFTGELRGKELYICGNEKCSFAADDDTALKDHMYVCDLSRDSSVLVCPHCSRQIKQFRPYLEHLKYHGEKRFHCGLCSFSAAVEFSVTSHLKQKHKCSSMKTVPKESKEGHSVYYPKNYKVEKVDFEVNGYLPGDEDKLPLQSVYQVNVKCAKCPYFTKVRSNMVRHLKIHVKSVETEGVVVVPSTAPTNPVPCLETKERMFDKMTNLAASSQLAQAKDKTAMESLSPEEEAKLPQFVAEQMRYKCCLPDCNYITVDDGMLKHHIKALHDEINYYSCPHCRSTVHVDVRHVTLDKIGFHLKHHDSKLYKCAHCIYFHYQKTVVEKHTAEKHPDRRYFIHVVREPKVEATSEEEPPSSTDGGARVWKCGLCNDFQSPSKSTLMDHLLKTHNTKSKYKCKFCSVKGNNHQAFISHSASKHPGEKVSYQKVYYSEKVASGTLEPQSGNSSGADSSNEHFDTTPLWQRGAPRVRHIRGILIEEEEIKTKKSKKTCESEADTSVTVNENAFYCPLCTNKKKPFYTRYEDCFRTHLYQELNYQQFACILCGKMFVDRKDFEKHHARVHADKAQSLKQTKEDHEIKFWVDQVIAKQRKQMEERKRKLNESEESAGDQAPPKRKKEV